MKISVSIVLLTFSSILRVEQQKLTGFSLCLNFVVASFCLLFLILFMTKGVFVGENCGNAWQFSLRVS